MNNLLTITGSFAMVWLSTWLLCSLLLSALYPLFRTHLMRLNPISAGSLVLLLLAFPMLLSLLSTTLLFIPGLEASLVSEHCHTDCQAHAPQLTSPLMAGLGLTAMAGVIFLLASKLVAHVILSRRLTNQLARLARPEEHYWLIEDDKPLVFTLGWWRNRIYLTTGLLAHCDEADIAIVLAHEKEHARRFDNVRLLLARLFLLVLPSRVADRLFDDLHLFTESACDLAAAGKSGHLDVASTLLKVQRLVPRLITMERASVTSAFTGAEIEQRIAVMLQHHGRLPERAGTVRALALALLICSVLLVDPLHHSVELLLQLAGI